MRPVFHRSRFVHHMYSLSAHFSRYLSHRLGVTASKFHRMHSTGSISTGYGACTYDTTDTFTFEVLWGRTTSSTNCQTLALRLQKFSNLVDEHRPRVSLVKGERYIRHDRSPECAEQNDGSLVEGLFFFSTCPAIVTASPL